MTSQPNRQTRARERFEIIGRSSPIKAAAGAGGVRPLAPAAQADILLSPGRRPFEPAFVAHLVDDVVGSVVAAPEEIDDLRPCRLPPLVR